MRARDAQWKKSESFGRASRTSHCIARICTSERELEGQDLLKLADGPRERDEGRTMLSRVGTLMGAAPGVSRSMTMSSSL